MGVLNILKYPNPILKRPSLDVENVDEALDAFIDDMVETMYEAKGIGLAAPQVGRSIRLAVIDCPDSEDYVRGKNLIILINPEITERYGNTISNEGCLSLPGLTVEVPRFERVVVRALNRKMEGIVIEGEGLLAIALQHEIDHLNGILLIDHLSRLKRDIVIRRFKKAHAG